MYNTGLTKAIRHLRRKNYDKAIKLLEPEEPIYRAYEREGSRYDEVFVFYYTLALAHLHTRKVFNVAFNYFKLARDIKMRDTSVLLGLALLFLRRGDTDRAVDLYLEVQDLDEKNRIAKRALRLIRKYSGTDHLKRWIDAGKLNSLFPLPPPPPPRTGAERAVLVAASVLSALVLSGGLLVRFDVLNIPVRTVQRVEREGFLLSALSMEELREPVQIDGSFRYILTQKEVFALYEEARTRFNEHRDEAARRAINKLLESNASDSIKTRANLLMAYMDVPGFDTLRDRFAFVDVINDPHLYRDCHVIWRGMAANLDVQHDTTAFNLLVGYDTRSTLQGIVPVIFDFSVPVNTEQPVEILGRVVPIVTDRGFDIKLEGVAIHQAGIRLGLGK